MVTNSEKRVQKSKQQQQQCRRRISDKPNSYDSNFNVFQTIAIYIFILIAIGEIAYIWIHG